MINDLSNNDIIHKELILPRNFIKSWKEVKKKYEIVITEYINNYLKVDPVVLCSREWNNDIEKLHTDRQRIIIKQKLIPVYKRLSQIKNECINTCKYSKCNKCYNNNSDCFCLIKFHINKNARLIKNDNNNWNNVEIPSSRIKSGWLKLAAEVDYILSKVVTTIIACENTRKSKLLRNIISSGLRNGQHVENENDDLWLCYICCRPFDSRYYIGQTTQGMHARRYTHLSASSGGKMEPVYQALRSSGIGTFSFIPIVAVRNSNTVDQILYVENQLIRMYDPPLNVNNRFSTTFSKLISTRKRVQGRKFKYQRDKNNTNEELVIRNDEHNNINNKVYMLGDDEMVKNSLDAKNIIEDPKRWMIHFANPLHHFKNTQDIPITCRLDAAYVCLSRRIYESKKINNVRSYLNRIVSLSELGYIFRQCYKKVGAKKFNNVKSNLKNLYPNDTKKIFGEIVSYEIEIPLGDRNNVQKKVCSFFKDEVIKIGKEIKFPFLLKLKIKNRISPSVADIMVNINSFCSQDNPPNKCNCHLDKYKHFDKLENHVLQRVSNLKTEITGIPEGFNSKSRLLPKLKNIKNQINSSFKELYNKLKEKFKSDIIIKQLDDKFINDLVGELKITDEAYSIDSIMKFNDSIKDDFVCTPCDKSRGDLVFGCKMMLGKKILQHYTNEDDYEDATNESKPYSEGFYNLHKKCYHPKLIKQKKSRKLHKYGLGTLWWKSKNWTYCEKIKKWILAKNSWDKLKYRPLSSYWDHYYKKTFQIASKCINSILRNLKFTDERSFMSMSYNDHFKRVHKFNNKVKKYKSNYNIKALGKVCIPVRDISNFFNKTPRRKAIKQLKKNIKEIIKKKNRKFIGIPKESISCIEIPKDGSIGMLRQRNKSGKQRIVFTDKSFSRNYVYLGLQDIVTIVEHDLE